MSHNSIHDPLIEDEGKILKYQNKNTSVKKENNPIIAAMLESLDKSVGQIINKLIDLNILDNTLIIFYSDNGGKHNHALQKPLRKGKGWLYEGGIRVPLIISWPKKVKNSFTYDPMVSSIDIMPTLYNLTNNGTSELIEFDGVDISSAFENKKIDREELFWHYPHYHQGSGMKPASAIRWKNYKLIEWHEPTILNGKNQTELYDLNNDLEEKFNLVEKKTKIAYKLKLKLHSWYKEINAQMPLKNNSF